MGESRSKNKGGERMREENRKEKEKKSLRSYFLLEQKIQLLKILLERSKMEFQQYDKQKEKFNKEEKESFEKVSDEALIDFYDFRERILNSLLQINENLKQKRSLDSSEVQSYEKEAFKTGDFFLNKIENFLKREEDLLTSILFYDHKIFSYLEKEKKGLLKDLHVIASDRRQMKAYKSL